MTENPSPQTDQRSDGSAPEQPAPEPTATEPKNTESTTADSTTAESTTAESTTAESTSPEQAAPEQAADELATGPTPEPTTPETAPETPAVETPAAETPAVETPAAETPAAESPTAETPAPAKKTVAKERQPGRPRPGRPRPAPGPRGKRPATQPIPAPVASDPTPWGRVGDDGSVFVKDPSVEGGERFVGSYPDAPVAEALAYYGRKFDELVGVVNLAESRLAAPDANVKEINDGLRMVREQLTEAGVVGDLASLAARLEALEGGLAQRRAAAAAERAEAKVQAQATRTTLVDEAEKIAGIDAKRMQWKQSTERMTALFEEWKSAQREGVKLDKPIEDELWKRFSHARTTFDRARRHHFSQLHAEHSEAKAAKEKLIAEAEALSSSTDWAGTSNAYRQLLERWKAVGRAGRKDDDALWARFRAAQDVFFAARGADNAKSDAEMADNLQVKEKLLAEAEALLPIKDIRAAKASLRSIQERWEEAGKVPRGDLQRVERRLKAVEQAVRDREDEKWRRSNPETKARAEGALGQLRDAIAGLEADLAKAKAQGNAKRIAEAEQALAARRAWLEAVQRTARDFG